MSYPSPTEIQFAAMDSRFIKDSFFEGMPITLLADGRAKMFAGGFSQVFIIEKDKEKWAFKVWYREIEENKNRYGEIKKYLKECDLPYFIEFEYVDGGLLVDGCLLDTLRMKWIDGHSLSEYISFNLENSDILRALARNFLKMTDDLHGKSISHGDLQHENIFVNRNGELKLIDYDSICVPSMEGYRDITRGRQSYQHPSRMTAGYIASTKIDYFSELIIYISILAVIENPLLWDKYGVTTADDKLLFSHWDFQDFENSKIRKDLGLLSEQIQNLVKILDNYLAAHLNLLPFKL